MYRKALFASVGMAFFMVGILLAVLDAGPVVARTTLELTHQAAPYPDQRDAVEKAVAWLVVNHQNDDGGYTNFSVGANQTSSDVAGTLDAILAIAAAGFNPAAPFPGKENGPVDYLLNNGDELAAFAAADGGQAGKAVLALVAADQDPDDFAGTDFVSILNDHRSFAGHFSVDNAFGQSLAILGLRAARKPVPESAVNWLVARQAANGDVAGSWDDGFGTEGNADTTALAIMALVSTGITPTNESLSQAVDFLARTRLPSGGWEYALGFGENINSTALAVQALSAVGVDFYSPDENGISPMAALLSWQGESGAFQADYGDGRFDDFYSTVQALPAAVGKPYPLPGRLEAAQEAVNCLASLQDPETGGWEQFATFGVNAAGTSRAIQAIVAVGDDPTSSRWGANSPNPVQALESLTSDYLAESRGGGVGIVMQGVVAAGGDINNFAGFDLELEMSRYLSSTGEYDDTSFGPFSQAEAMLGLLDAGVDVDPAAVDWLLNAHNAGDWGGPDSTGIALNVLGRLGIVVDEAIDVLHASQEADGGWGFGSASPSSSSEVVQGLVGVGENPFAPTWSRIVSGTITNVADAILALQGENGCWPNLFGPGEDPFATTDAVLLLTQRPVWSTTMIELVPEPVLTAEPTDVPAEATTTTLPTVETTPQATVPSATSPPEAVATETSPGTEVAEANLTPEVSAAPDGGETGVAPINPLIIGGAVVLLLLIAAAAIYRTRGR